MKTKNAGILTDMAPTAAEMIEMLNVDVLPYFDEYDSETFMFSEKYRAVSVLAETQDGWAIALNDGSEIVVSDNYFQFPGAEKEITLSHLKTKLV